MTGLERTYGYTRLNRHSSSREKSLQVYTTDPELLTWIAEKFGKFRSRPLAESADRNYGIYIWDVDEPDAWWLITQLCLRGWEPFHAHKNPWEDEVWGDRWEFKKELLA